MFDRAARSKAKRVESVDAFAILERDKYICQICFRQTFAALRGTFEPLAPEVDHIKPLSKGGNHVVSNLQCACRGCNGRKGDGYGYDDPEYIEEERGDVVLPEDEWAAEIAEIERNLAF